MQVVVTYERATNEWKSSVPLFAIDRLRRTIARLRAGAIRIALLGDSISTGRNASGHENVVPFQPGYHDLLASGLRAAYEADVKLTNLSVSGMGTRWGIASALGEEYSQLDFYWDLTRGGICTAQRRIGF